MKNSEKIMIPVGLYDALLKHKVSKRQHDIIDLILYLSQDRKAAYIPQLNFFEIVGIYKQDIKNELEQLEAAAVIFWNRAGKMFSINENYHVWKLPVNKKYDQELSNKLIEIQKFN